MLKIELTKFHRIVDYDNFDEIEKAYYVNDDLVEGKKLTYKERKALPDSAYAVIIRVKNKRTGEIRKIRKYPIQDEAHVRNALARLGQDKARQFLKEHGISIDSVLRKVFRRAKQLGMTELLLRNKEELKRLGLPAPKVKATMIALDEVLSAIPKEVSDCVRKKIKDGMKPVDAVKECWTQYNDMKQKATDELIESIKANAKEIIKRREELGEYANDFTDLELLDEKNYEFAKVKKERDELKSVVNANDIADLHTAHSDSKKTSNPLRDIIDNKANQIRKNS